MCPHTDIHIRTRTHTCVSTFVHTHRASEKEYGHWYAYKTSPDTYIHVDTHNDGQPTFVGSQLYTYIHRRPPGSTDPGWTRPPTRDVSRKTTRLPYLSWEPYTFHHTDPSLPTLHPCRDTVVNTTSQGTRTEDWRVLKSGKGLEVASLSQNRSTQNHD